MCQGQSPRQPIRIAQNIRSVFQIIWPELPTFAGVCTLWAGWLDQGIHFIDSFIHACLYESEMCSVAKDQRQYMLVQHFSKQDGIRWVVLNGHARSSDWGGWVFGDAGKQVTRKRCS